MRHKISIIMPSRPSQLRFSTESISSELSRPTHDSELSRSGPRQIRLGRLVSDSAESLNHVPERYCQGVEDPCRLRACSGSHRGFNPSLVGPEQPVWASIFQEVPRGEPSGCRGPCRLRACSGSHRCFKPLLAGSEQPVWASLHLSGGSPRGVVRV